MRLKTKGSSPGRQGLSTILNRVIRAAAAMASLVAALAFPSLASADIFFCFAGNESCLIESINDANGNGVNDTIILQDGTYTLTEVDNTTGGPNGLPSISSAITIRGSSPIATTIRRDPSLGLGEPRFRIFHVTASGALTLEGLTIQGGHAAFDPELEHSGFGGGLLNDGGAVEISDCIFRSNRADYGGGVHILEGSMAITGSTLTDNTSIFFEGAGFGSGGDMTSGGTTVIAQTAMVDNDGGGVFNIQGDVSIERSTVARNSGTGLQNHLGTLTADNSAIFDNAKSGTGGGVSNTVGTVIITDSTIAGNSATSHGGGIYTDHFSEGTLTLTNVTVSNNSSSAGFGGGLFAEHQGVQLQNTIVAKNHSDFGADCSGSVGGLFTSLGNNLIGDPEDCAIVLLPSDLTGDAGLGTFTDDGTPGKGHLPLLGTSQAVDAGDHASCAPADQVGQVRFDGDGDDIVVCDIGAIEFFFLDEDGDGVPDDSDECPDSDLAPTVVISGCDSEVPNAFLPNGCTIEDLVLQCAASAGNHGAFISCVSEAMQGLKDEGVITGAQKGAIQSCAAGAAIP